MFSKKSNLKAAVAAKFAVILTSGLAYSTSANAQAITKGLCYIVDQYKLVLGTVALIAILVAVVNGFFSKNSLVATLVETVIIGCGIAAVATVIVTSTGLVVSC